MAASKETLKARGYHVEALNLIEPEIRSMSFQILRMVIDAYEEGDLGKAEQHAKAIAHMLYSDPDAKDKFWQDSASSLCTALILGLCEKNLPDHPEKITMYSVANTLNELASQQETDEKGTMISGLDHFFDSLPRNHPAKLQYATVKFASGAGQTVAGIFANAFDKLSIFTLTPIAKMTSYHSFDMRKVGFGKHITGFASAQGEVTATFPEGTERTRANTNGLFKFSHDRSLKKGQTVTFHDHKTDATLTVMVEAINEETGTVTYKVQNEHQEVMTLREFEHFTKPTAVFLLTPDDDTSLHVIASLYVKQLYTELAKTSYFTPGRKCIRQVIFILDEFGNMPSISDMGNMITVSLGRRIHFNLVVQDLSQIKHKYDKEADNIIGNCANKMYLLSTDYETNEEFSKLLGEKTISSNSRSGSTLSTDKNKTEGTDGRRLLDASELGRLKPGEMVVYRGIKREDLNRENVTPYPIYNHGKTRMKFRYEYLSDQFNTDTDLEDIDIPCDHAGLDLTKVIYRFEDENTDYGPANQDGPKQHQPQEPSPEGQQEEADSNQDNGENPDKGIEISEEAMAFEQSIVQDVLDDQNLLTAVEQHTDTSIHHLPIGLLEEYLDDWQNEGALKEGLIKGMRNMIQKKRRDYHKELEGATNDAEPVSSTTN
ncbi:VirD4-like conjugal transfer protein, CD1115 family [Marinococcus halophilus]|uniref:VirD4-like conjugal transfer protein, CD1115 family n=1 Tax=Marinococcus halophilus TaxID=1371 RepID=UPI003CC836BA